MKRAFTLLELLIVLPLTAILTTCTMILLGCLTSEFRAAALQGDLKLEAQRATSAIFGRAALGHYKIHSDQRGLTFADGGQLRWEGQRLVLGSRQLTENPVREFLAIKRDGNLVINLVLESPLYWRGEPRPSRFIYDYPSLAKGDL